ncbi:hypothetical protein HAX54_004934 [Datura stramonium]|uniref:Uncharacterized protein n=1 Tax=Datura stramonium TaxID=4076 RepID=A0ABS8T7T2_DATST|nr:hypothetical protein [Datura stramonium]
MGKRACIPTRKAQEAVAYGGGQVRKKGNLVQEALRSMQEKEIGRNLIIEEEADAVANTVTNDVNTEGSKPVKLLSKAIEDQKNNELAEVRNTEEEHIAGNRTITPQSNATVTGNIKEVSSNQKPEAMARARRLSWAEKVEADPDLEKKTSIWDNFDISKVSNAGFKLDFVAPDKHGEIPICEIALEDISSEVLFWENSKVCYVLGANPPFSVLNGFIQRQWAKHGINKGGTLSSSESIAKGSK